MTGGDERSSAPTPAPQGPIPAPQATRLCRALGGRRAAAAAPVFGARGFCQNVSHVPGHDRGFCLLAATATAAARPRARAIAGPAGPRSRAPERSPRGPRRPGSNQGAFDPASRAAAPGQTTSPHPPPHRGAHPPGSPGPAPPGAHRGGRARGPRDAAGGLSRAQRVTAGPIGAPLQARPAEYVRALRARPRQHRTRGVGSRPRASGGRTVIRRLREPEGPTLLESPQRNVYILRVEASSRALPCQFRGRAVYVGSYPSAPIRRLRRPRARSGAVRRGGVPSGRWP